MAQYNDIADHPTDGVLDGWNNGGNTATDNEPAFTDAISDADSNNLPIFLGGAAVIKSTVTVPYQQGYKFVGSGGLRFIHNKNQSFSGPGATVIWAGSDGGTMFTFRGSNVSWSDISLWALNFFNPVPSGTPIAGIGFLIDPDVNTGLQAGSINFHNVYIDEADVGIKIVGDVKNITGTGLVGFVDCVDGYRVENASGMYHCFESVLGNSVNTFNFRAGGTLNVNSTVITDSAADSLLRVATSDADYMHANFSMIKRDAGVRDCRFLTMEQQGYGQFKFGQIHLGINAPDIDEYVHLMFDLKGAPNLQIHGHNRMWDGAIRVTDNYANAVPSILVQGCAINTENPLDIISSDSVGDYNLSIQDCYYSGVSDYNDGHPVPNIRANSSGGLEIRMRPVI